MRYVMYIILDIIRVRTETLSNSDTVGRGFNRDGFDKLTSADHAESVQVARYVLVL